MLTFIGCFVVDPNNKVIAGEALFQFGDHLRSTFFITELHVKRLFFLFVNLPLAFRPKGRVQKGKNVIGKHEVGFSWMIFSAQRNFRS